MQVNELPPITVPLGWYVYFCMRDDAPTSVAVDLTFDGDAPDRDLSWVTIVRIELLDPVGGLAMGVEAEVLDEITEMFEDVANRVRPGLFGRFIKRSPPPRFRYVGRETGNGFRQLYFYGTAPVPASVYKRVFAVPKFGIYNVASFEREDPERTTYREDLHPGVALNALVLSDAQIEIRKEEGDDLGVEREVVHRVWFSTAEDRRRFVELFEQDAHAFTIELTDPADEAERFGVTLRCNHSVDQMWTNIYVVALAGHAAKCGGKYDGWEALVILP